MSRTWRRAFHGLLAVALLVAMVPVAAVAQTETARPQRATVELSDEQRSDRLDTVKERVISQIERRLTALDRLVGKVRNADHIAEEHAALLAADIDSAQRVLEAGIGTVRSVETLDELHAIAPPLFATTLVFALLGPKTHAVIASDAVAAATLRFTEIGAKLQEALDRLAAAGIDTAEAQAELDEMNRLVAEASSTGEPIAGSVVGLQPSNWPDPAKSALADAKTALQRARTHLRTARDLGKQVAVFIRGSAADG